MFQTAPSTQKFTPEEEEKLKNWFLLMGPLCDCEVCMADWKQAWGKELLELERIKREDL